MTGFGYIGQAGTGKTTQLMKKVEESIDFDNWPDSAAILAITFMHGSRRRLENTLRPIQHKGIKVCCQTIDSFCLNLIKRYRSYLGISKMIIVSDDPDEQLEHDSRLHLGIHKIREKAKDLLDLTIVKDVLEFSYPIVVVDEFQDCDGDLLEIIKKLSNCGSLFVAADDFQKLDNSPNCPATEWLAQAIELNQLEKIWRTGDGKILESAKALRKDEATTNGVEVVFAESENVAAYFILSNMQWYDKMGSGSQTVVILSPVGPQSDNFVYKTLERLKSPMSRKANKKKKGYRLEARPFHIENEKRISAQQILDQCAGWDSLASVTQDAMNSWTFDKHAGFDIAVKRAKRVMKLRNTESLSKFEFAGLISSSLHFANTFMTRRGNSRIFLTVHGAKNREFDDVFILWPMYTLPKEELYLKKLLYNAITRAKRKVVVIVQGSKNRKSECPLYLINK